MVSGATLSKGKPGQSELRATLSTNVDKGLSTTSDRTRPVASEDVLR